MNEAGFIRAVHAKLPRNPNKFRAEKITMRYNGDVPDCYYSGSRCGWIEYKWTKTTPKIRHKPTLSSGQRDWLRAETDRGIPCFVIVGSDAGHYLYSTAQQWETSTRIEDLQRFETTRQVAQWIENYFQPPSQGML